MLDICRHHQPGIRLPEHKDKSHSIIHREYLKYVYSNSHTSGISVPHVSASWQRQLYSVSFPSVGYVVVQIQFHTQTDSLTRQHTTFGQASGVWSLIHW